MNQIRLLYFLGAGPAAAQRTDVAELFGKRLAAMGLQITWYLRTSAPGGPVMRRDYHGSPARLCGRSTLPGLPGSLVDKLKQALATLHFFAQACTVPCDIIQVRDDFLAGVLGLAAARLRGRRFVFWLSFPFPESRLMDAREGRARSPAYAWLAGHLGAFLLYRVILPRVDHAFVQSEQMKRDIVCHGINSARLSPVPMGVPDQDLPVAISAPGSEPVVLYLGSLARARRLEMIVQAFGQVRAAVPSARLVIVGSGDVPEDRAELEDEVQRLGLSGAVEFTGQLPRGEALAWVERAAVCLSPIYPSAMFRVASPTKLIEYMAFGRPVVANDQPPEQAQVMAASGAGVCTPWRAADFAQAIVDLLTDPQRRQRAGADGRRWVEQHRLYSQLAADVKQHYDALLRSNAAAQ